MKATSRHLSFLPLGAACVIFALAGLTPVVAQAPTIQPKVIKEKNDKPARKRSPKGADQKNRLRVPGQVNRDFFTGTWSRVGPGERHAVHIRQNESTKEWEVRLFWRTTEGFQIDTNWQTRHDYTYRGFTGFLEIVVDQEKSDKDRVVAAYSREQDGDRGSHLVETGNLVLYRATVHGRTLVWLQDPLIQEITVEDTLYPDEKHRRFEDRRLWLFEKAADRHLLWDEIYW